VHALLVPFVLALAGNFPALKFLDLRLLLALCLDDRLAIIGSANINEQSQLGDRDSELAPIIRGAPGPRCAHIYSCSLTLCGHGVHAASSRELGSALRGRLWSLGPWETRI
ncbi:hypothetical protein B0H14DRAFT_3888576, partial [Mycena olivaceomarginata]